MGGFPVALFLLSALWHSACRRITGRVQARGIGFYLAVVAGFLATVIAGVARNEIMKRAGASPDDSKIPNLVLIYSAVASLGGSSLADEVVRISGLDSAVWLGMLAGLFSCILLAMLLITYYTNPETGRPWKM